MCLLRLPNEVTSYRPCGMLDRDQRTAFTISKKCKVPSIFLTTTTTPSSCITSADTTSELNYKNSNQKCSNSSFKCKSVLPTVGMPTTAKDLFGCKCDCQQLNNSVALNLWKENTSMASRRKYPTASGYYQSRTKLVNCLLVFICIWFVAIQHTCAYPLSQMDKLSSENNDPDALSCEVIRTALNTTLEQSYRSSGFFDGILKAYTHNHFNEEPTSVDNLWKNTPAHFRYNNDHKIRLLPDYKAELNETHFPHLSIREPPSVQELENEMQPIYIHLHALNKVFTAIQNDYVVNKEGIKKHLTDGTKFNYIKTVFDNQLSYVISVMHELEIAMSTLKIQKPQLPPITIDNNMEIDSFGAQWIATREHLKTLRYMQGILKILIQRCS